MCWRISKVIWEGGGSSYVSIGPAKRVAVRNQHLILSNVRDMHPSRNQQLKPTFLHQSRRASGS